MVLEGEAVITPENGNPPGLKVEWHVPKYIRKTFVLRTPEPLAG